MAANKPMTMFDVTSPTIAIAIEHSVADTRSSKNVVVARLLGDRVHAMVEL